MLTGVIPSCLNRTWTRHAFMRVVLAVQVRGTELEGIPRELMQNMLRFLEKQGRARMFKGSIADDEGVKFFP